MSAVEKHVLTRLIEEELGIFVRLICRDRQVFENIVMFFRFIMFDNYRIPKANLLNRTGDVTSEGEYESSFSDPQRILGNLCYCIF